MKFDPDEGCGTRVWVSPYICLYKLVMLLIPKLLVDFIFVIVRLETGNSRALVSPFVCPLFALKDLLCC